MKLFGRIFYYLLKVHLFFAFRLYFRRFQMDGFKNVPAKGPIIFAPNHQNALLDSLLAGGPTWRCTYFLARGDIFKKKLVGAFLRGLKMLPVFRFRDGLANVKKNAASFDASVGQLLKGKPLLLFPEGNHSLQYGIRPLQKGLPRIAFEVEERAGFSANLKVVPVGLQYEDHFARGSRMLVSFGEPISVADYQALFQETPRKAYEALLADLSDRMKGMVLHIPNDRYEEVHLQWKAHRVYHRDLVAQLQADQALVDRILRGEVKENPPKPFRLPFGGYDLFTWVLHPFNLLPAALADFITKKKVKDPHFIGSIRFVLSMYLFPLFYLLYFLLVFGWLDGFAFFD